jgi:hypothetical protein
MRVKAAIGGHSITVAWDISTGDPVIPLPALVKVPRVLGEPIEMLGYAPETIVAEKGVTVLERGTTSTRWRDYVDIVQLARQGVDPDALLRSAHAVARHRGVTLEPIEPHVADHGRAGQAKWAAWRRKEQLQAVSEEKLDDQIALIASLLDPIFATQDQTP